MADSLTEYKGSIYMRLKDLETARKFSIFMAEHSYKNGEEALNALLDHANSCAGMVYAA